MTLEENKKTFGDIIAGYNLPMSLVRDTARAVAMADMLHRTDGDRGSYGLLRLEALAKSGIPCFSGVCSSLGVENSQSGVDDVAQMRLMCDVATLCLAQTSQLKDFTRFGLRYSSDVARALRLQIGQSGDYLEFSDCESILQGYRESIQSTENDLGKLLEFVQQLDFIAGRIFEREAEPFLEKSIQDWSHVQDKQNLRYKTAADYLTSVYIKKSSGGQGLQLRLKLRRRCERIQENYGRKPVVVISPKMYKRLADEARLMFDILVSNFSFSHSVVAFDEVGLMLYAYGLWGNQFEYPSIQI